MTVSLGYRRNSGVVIAADRMFARMIAPGFTTQRSQVCKLAVHPAGLPLACAVNGQWFVEGEDVPVIAERAFRSIASTSELRRTSVIDTLTPEFQAPLARMCAIGARQKVNLGYVHTTLVVGLIGDDGADLFTVAFAEDRVITTVPNGVVLRPESASDEFVAQSGWNGETIEDLNLLAEHAIGVVDAFIREDIEKAPNSRTTGFGVDVAILTSVGVQRLTHPAE